MKKLALALLVIVVATNFCSAQQQYYDVTPGDGYGLRFWQDNQYKIHMGNSSEYHYGPVTDYSIKMNMNNSSVRGWTWGVVGLTPVAAINTSGNMQIAGSLTTPLLQVNVNPNNAGLAISGNTSSNTVADLYITRANSSSGVGNAPALQFSDTGSGSHNIIQGSSSGLQFYNYYSSGPWTERMRIDPSGKVGIGTTSPSAKLHISAADRTQALRVYMDGNTTNYLTLGQGSGGAVIDPIGTGNLFLGYDVSTNVIVGGNNSGKLGIGTSTPASMLHINSAVERNTFRIYKNTTTANYLSIWQGDGGAAIDPIGTGKLWLGYDQATTVLVPGSIGIGTTNPGSYKLAVEGKIGAREVNVIATNPWPDYVFEKNYNLPTLESIKTYIDQNKHLPEVPSAKEIEKNGVNLGEMNALLLKKIEELTMYVIELKKENDSTKEQMKNMQSEINQIKK